MALIVGFALALLLIITICSDYLKRIAIALEKLSDPKEPKKG